MRVILVSMGSMGDTMPFVVVGRAMQERGHDITLIGNEHFTEMFKSVGFEFAASLTEQQYQDFLHGQAEWSGLRALKEMGELVRDQLPKVYDLVTERYVPGETIVVAQGYALGARVAQETHGLPLATVHLQPMWFRSVYDPPGVPDWMPRWYPGMFDRLIDFAIDRGVGKTVNEFRQQLGLPIAKFVMKHWWNSPQLVLGMFPEWYNRPQPDWPPQTQLPGFPIYKPREDEAMPPALEEFLNAGDPPILFMQSTVTCDAHDFFEVSAQAAAAVGRRAILLTPHGDQIPNPLPKGVAHFSWLPLDSVLPRCALHVHHGGIGTIGHTLAAGIPHLTVPMVYDQPDNAQRLKRLGVSSYLKPSKYKLPRVVRELKQLLGSSEIRERCRYYAEKSKQSDFGGNVCRALEKLHEDSLAAKGRPSVVAAR